MEQSPSCCSSRNFPTFYGTRRYESTSLHLQEPTTSLYPKTDHSSSFNTPSPQSYWRFILILSSHLCLDFPSGLFPWISPTKIPYVPYPLPHMCYIAICPAYLISLRFVTWAIFDGDYRSWSSSICSLLVSPVTSSLLGPNIFLSALFWNTLRLSFFLNVRGQVPHPYTTTDRIITAWLHRYTSE